MAKICQRLALAPAPDSRNEIVEILFSLVASSCATVQDFGIFRSHVWPN